MDFSDPIAASLIGAAATVLTALVQLRISWRKELKDRERGQPITRKTRRGPVIAVFVLMIAAAFGGFFLSQYIVSLREEDQDTLRTELKSQLSQLNASAARLEEARLTERGEIEAGILRAAAVRGGEEGVAASVLVGPCRAENGSVPSVKSPCNEQGAVRVAVCARVPKSAIVKDVQLYTRFDDVQQSWADSRVQAGLDAGQAKFAEKFFERPDGEATKQVCQSFVNWSSDKARLARIVVRYSL